MKKILVFGMSENFGGVETIIMNYYRNINKEKVQFDFLYNTEKIAYEDEIKKMNGNLYKITPRAKGIKKYKKDMKKFFKQHADEYSAIWVNLCILSNIDWLKYAKKYGIKCRIIHSHNSKNMTTRIKYILHKINKMFLKKYATNFWACSDEAGKWFYSNSIRKSNKYKIINNAINIDEYKFDEEMQKEYREKLQLQNKFIVGHIGRFHFQKNHEFLIDVFNEIHKKNIDSHLLLIGQGEDEEKIKDKVNELNLTDSVSFLGMRKDIKQLFQAMDIFLLPSLFEGLPLVVLEAQANGVFVYASEEGIPKNAKMSESFEFISLNKSAKEWADIILSKKYKRVDNAESIRISGYDIREEAKKMEKFFLMN